MNEEHWKGFGVTFTSPGVSQVSIGRIQEEGTRRTATDTVTPSNLLHDGVVTIPTAPKGVSYDDDEGRAIEGQVGPDVAGVLSCRSNTVTRGTVTRVVHSTRQRTPKTGRYPSYGGWSLRVERKNSDLGVSDTGLTVFLPMKQKM